MHSTRGCEARSRQLPVLSFRLTVGRSDSHPTYFIMKPLLLLIPALVITGIAACSTPRAPAPTPTAASTAAMTPRHEWILVDLPPGATQLDYGAEVYRLVCQDCHGNHGQGLTGEWRATWAPQDQNCWQSKCHGQNHPPDGFFMPIAPAIAGAGTLSQFGTAAQLQSFIQIEMPWYNPGSLTSKDSWAAAAWILHMNQIDPGKDLNAVTAANIRLR